MSGTDALKDLIQTGLTDQAVKMVRGAEGYLEAEEFVSVVLADEKSPSELVEATLETFLYYRTNCKPYHGYWVHSLSHFTNVLWERRMDSWIKKFNDVSFKGANKLRDPNCSDRLVWDFAAFAKWDDDPADFHLTPENLSWMNWEYSQYQKARIDAAPFQSEEAFLRWKLNEPKAYASDGRVDVDKMLPMIQRLKELGADTSESSEFARGLFTKQLKKLESELRTAKEWWQRERLEEEIQKTRAALAELA